jgi:hypothetical protein
MQHQSGDDGKRRNGKQVKESGRGLFSCLQVQPMNLVNMLISGEK